MGEVGTTGVHPLPMTDPITPNPEESQAAKLDKLRTALEEFSRRQEEGAPSTLFDREAEEKKAEVRRRALLLLDQRARSRSELRERLLALELDPEVIDEVLGDLTRARSMDIPAGNPRRARAPTTRRNALS